MKKTFLGFTVLVLFLFVSTAGVYGQSAAAKAAFDRGFKALDKGSYDIAIREFTEAIRLHGSYKEAYYGRMYAYAFKKEWNKVLFDSSYYIGLDPKNAEAHNVRGDAYLGLKSPTSAKADYEAALRIDPKNAYAKAALANLSNPSSPPPAKSSSSNASSPSKPASSSSGSSTKTLSPCPVCHGDGKCTFVSKFTGMQACKGRGYYECPVCDGKGVTTNDNKICWSCRGKKTVECELCHGSGKCRRCDGTGKV